MFDTLKHIYTQDEALELVSRYEKVYNEKIEKLEEENRLLKNEIAWLKDHTKYNGITEAYYIDWTMTATEAKLRLQQAEDNKNYVSKLEEENRNLNKLIEQFKKWVKAWTNIIERLEEENEKLKEELEWYKKQYEHSMWED